MIQYIKLKNYKSYNDITFDFRGKNNAPKKLIIVMARTVLENQV